LKESNLLPRADVGSDGGRKIGAKPGGTSANQKQTQGEESKRLAVETFGRRLRDTMRGTRTQYSYTVMLFSSHKFRLGQKVESARYNIKNHSVGRAKYFRRWLLDCNPRQSSSRTK
jgi:hypothetical protein